MESKKMIKRKIENLEKALEKVIFKNDEDCVVVFLYRKKIWAHYLTTQRYVLLLKFKVP